MSDESNMIKSNEINSKHPISMKFSSMKYSFNTLMRKSEFRIRDKLMNRKIDHVRRVLANTISDILTDSWYRPTVFKTITGIA